MMADFQNGLGLISRKFSVFCSFLHRQSLYGRSSQIGFSASGMWLIQNRDSGFGRKGGARFGIVIMTGTRDLVILTGGIREMSL